MWGLKLRGLRAFRWRASEVRKESGVKQAIMGEVSNPSSRSGNRVLTSPPAASLLNFGLAVTSTAASEGDFAKLGTYVLNQAARRVARSGYSVGGAAPCTLADLSPAHNRFLLKTANVLDGTLRARKTQARKHLWRS